MNNTAIQLQEEPVRWADIPFDEVVFLEQTPDWVIAGRRGWNDWFKPCDHGMTMFQLAPDVLVWRQEKGCST